MQQEELYSAGIEIFYWFHFVYNSLYIILKVIYLKISIQEAVVYILSYAIQTAHPALHLVKLNPNWYYKTGMFESKYVKSSKLSYMIDRSILLAKFRITKGRRFDGTVTNLWK